MANFVRCIKNPFFNAMMTYVEILPVGVDCNAYQFINFKKKSSKKLNRKRTWEKLTEIKMKETTI